MNRTGRKRKGSGLFVVREPTGRLSRAVSLAEDECSPGEVKRLRTAALAGMQAQVWGTELGRLFLASKITSEAFEAGKRWMALIASYYDAIMAPKPNPSPMPLERHGHSHPVDPDSDAGRKEAANHRETLLMMGEAHAVLIGAGVLAENAVRTVCERDIALVGHEALQHLSRGLTWLAEHWDLTPSGKSRYGRNRN